MFALRAAMFEDAPRLAQIHVDVWRQTYRDLAPDAAFRALDERHRRAFWSNALSTDRSEISVLVAELAGTVAGFALGGPAGERLYGARAEIRYLYVDRAYARRGIGRRLLLAIQAEMLAKGAPGIGLGVVVGNAAAIAFYEAMGGRLIGRYEDPGPIWRSDNLLYVWDGDMRPAT